MTRVEGPHPFPARSPPMPVRPQSIRAVAEPPALVHLATRVARQAFERLTSRTLIPRFDLRWSCSNARLVMFGQRRSTRPVWALILVCLSIGGASFLLAAEGELRTWSDGKGKFKIKARLVS